MALGFFRLIGAVDFDLSSFAPDTQLFIGGRTEVVAPRRLILFYLELEVVEASFPIVVVLPAPLTPTHHPNVVPVGFNLNVSSVPTVATLPFSKICTISLREVL